MKKILMIEINGNDEETLDLVVNHLQNLINVFEEEELQYEEDDIVIDIKLYDDVDDIEI